MNFPDLQKIYISSREVLVMKLQVIFYGIGLIFLFAAVSYFSYEYLMDLSYLAKTVILFLASIIVFTIAHLMRGRDI